LDAGKPADRQRFSDLFTVGMKIAKRKMMKPTQAATHPSSFTLCNAIVFPPDVISRLRAHVLAMRAGDRLIFSRMGLQTIV
jgi:hypothetical protein